MDAVAKRITLLIEHLDLSSAEFADACEIKRPILSHILSGRNNPSLMVVSHVIEAFPNVNLNWLLLGKGHMFTNVNERQTTTKPNDTYTNVNQRAALAPPVVNSPKLNVTPAQNQQLAAVTNVNSSVSKQNIEIPANKEAAAPMQINQLPLQQLQIKTNQRQLRQIVMFYTDGTFETFGEISVAPSVG